MIFAHAGMEPEQGKVGFDEWPSVKPSKHTNGADSEILSKIVL